jgi:hypothetical protein
MKRSILGVAAVVFALCGAEPARADLVYTLTTDSKGDSATADFKFVTGGLEIVVTNTGSATGTDSANAISGVQIFFNTSNVSAPTSFTELSGDQITYAGKGAGTDQGFQDFKGPSKDPNLHWDVVSTGSNSFGLDNVQGGALPGFGGQPAEMIVPLNATTSSNSLSNFNPSFNGTANFFLAFSKLPATLTKSDITDVKFSFGTGPEDSLQSGTGSGTTPLAAPEPATNLLVLSGLVPVAAWMLRSRAVRTSRA